MWREFAAFFSTHAIRLTGRHWPARWRACSWCRHCRVVGYLSSRTGKILPCTMRRDGESIELQGRYVIAVDDGNAYLEAGLAGLGVHWLPDYLSKAHLARGELAPLFAGWRLDPMPLYVAFPPNRRVSAKLRVFIDWVAELMEQHAPVTGRRGS